MVLIATEGFGFVKRRRAAGSPNERKPSGALQTRDADNDSKPVRVLPLNDVDKSKRSDMDVVSTGIVSSRLREQMNN